MSIDINNIGGNRPENTRRQETNREIADKTASSDRAEQKGEQASNNTARGENVSLSSAAKGLAQLENSLKELPEVDEARVSEIKARVESGQYQVNSNNLAQKMLGMDG